LERVNRLLDFEKDTVRYFLAKVQNVDKDRYFADRDLRSILDKTINDMILCLIDIAEECLKKHHKTIPDTYRDTILACYEILGEVVLRVAPLVKHRNEAIHQYLKVNWQNIQVVRNRIADIEKFMDQAAVAFTSEHPD
jgi:uncharacterized protein YutE (UPF0331/DUF86 family)